MSSLADWVSGIGTLLAVVVALAFSLRETLDRRYDRFASVAVWAESQETTGTSNPEVKSSRSQAGWVFVTVSDLKQPISRWSCTLTYQSSAGVFHEGISHEDVGLLVPGRHEYPWSPKSPPDAESLVSTVLWFVDTTGAVWSRKLGGQVKRHGRGKRAFREFSVFTSGQIA
jgi:hypothetical protein